MIRSNLHGRPSSSAASQPWNPRASLGCVYKGEGAARGGRGNKGDEAIAYWGWPNAAAVVVVEDDAAASADSDAYAVTDKCGHSSGSAGAGDQCCRDGVFITQAAAAAGCGAMERARCIMVGGPGSCRVGAAAAARGGAKGDEGAVTEADESSPSASDDHCCEEALPMAAANRINKHYEQDLQDTLSRIKGASSTALPPSSSSRPLSAPLGGARHGGEASRRGQLLGAAVQGDSKAR